MTKNKQTPAKPSVSLVFVSHDHINISLPRQGDIFVSWANRLSTPDWEHGEIKGAEKPVVEISRSSEE